MDQNQDFSKLRHLLALKRLEMPLDTNVDRFLIELHRRQRAQLMVPTSAWSRAVAWLKERATIPSLSYASAFAAIAVTVFVSLSQQVEVTQVAGHADKLSFHMPARDTSFAMIPASFAAVTSPKMSEIPNFNRSAATATRFVLANTPRVAYDATVAF